MNKYTKYFSAISVVAALAACGGGGGGGQSGADGGGGAPPSTQSWQQPQDLAPAANGVDTMATGINANGVGFAVWEQSVGTVKDVFASRYINGVWEPAQKVNIDGLQIGASEPKVVVLPDGEALVAWQRGKQGAAQGVAFKRSANGKWTSPTAFLRNENEDISDLELVVNDTGSAAVVWVSKALVPAAKGRVFGAGFNNGAFEPAVELSSGTVEPRQPDVAIDAEGNALAVWVQGTLIRARPHVGTVWKATQDLVSSPNGTQVGFPDVAVGLDGVAAVAAHNGNTSQIEYRRAINFIEGNWFPTLVSVGEPGIHRTFPQVTLDHLGIATMIWVEEENIIADSRSLRSARTSTPGSALTLDPVETSLDRVGREASLHVGVDASGRAMAVWEQATGGIGGGPMQVFSNRYDPSTDKWGTAEQVAKRPGNQTTTAMALNAKGQAAVSWWHSSSGVPQANVFK